MCGIAGFSGSFDESLLTRMSAALAHRGPDDAGLCFLPGSGIGLAHRRLSIIDLSPAGHQPMSAGEGAPLISYNGELYNFRELRAELEAAGVRFRGRSDTEMLLEAIARWGVEKALSCRNFR